MSAVVIMILATIGVWTIARRIFFETKNVLEHMTNFFN